MLTNNQIAKGKRDLQSHLEYFYTPAKHEHRDCIRMTYLWLDAQIKTQYYRQNGFVDKHMIENWCGRYISSSDLTVAASMHPEIEGIYPKFNISKSLVFPHWQRLNGINQAFIHDYMEADRRHFKETYTYFELDDNRLETVSHALTNRISTDPLFKNIGFKI